MTGEIGLQSAPVVAKDIVIVGAAFREGMTPKSMNNTKGYVRAFDVRTGKRLWIFHTIPTKGEFGYDTWLNGSADYTGNTGVWAQISVDEQLGLVYLPVESPTGDYYGGHRPGNDLFGESLVCVDLKTGQRKWYYQLVHHPLWDMDISSAPAAGGHHRQRQAVKAVGAADQAGNPLRVRSRDRQTGVARSKRSRWRRATCRANGIHRRSLSQPSRPPTRATASRQDDLIDFTPALHDQAMTLVAKYKIGPVFTPPVVSKPTARWRSSPAAANGGTNWPGGSFDPETHTVYVVRVQRLCRRRSAWFPRRRKSRI